jgi:hypothetical protein
MDILGGLFVFAIIYYALKKIFKVPKKVHPDSGVNQNSSANIINFNRTTKNTDYSSEDLEIPLNLNIQIGGKSRSTSNTDIEKPVFNNEIVGEKYLKSMVKSGGLGSSLDDTLHFLISNKLKVVNYRSKLKEDIARLKKKNLTSSILEKFDTDDLFKIDIEKAESDFLELISGLNKLSIEKDLRSLVLGYLFYPSKFICHSEKTLTAAQKLNLIATPSLSDRIRTFKKADFVEFCEQKGLKTKGTKSTLEEECKKHPDFESFVNGKVDTKNCYVLIPEKESFLNNCKFIYHLYEEEVFLVQEYAQQEYIKDEAG